MSDGIAMKAEFADRIDKLNELAEAERETQAAKSRFQQAQHDLVHCAESLLEWDQRLHFCRNAVIASYPDDVPAQKALIEAQAVIDRFCAEVREQNDLLMASAPGRDPKPQDDASEFTEEGYAPVIEAEPLADPIWNEPEPDREALAAADAERFQEALESSNQATDAEIDAAIRAGEIAKAVDYYDPKAMADRERFNPFNIFKREGEH